MRDKLNATVTILPSTRPMDWSVRVADGLSGSITVDTNKHRQSWSITIGDDRSGHDPGDEDRS